MHCGIKKLFESILRCSYSQNMMMNRTYDMKRSHSLQKIYYVFFSENKINNIYYNIKHKGSHQENIKQDIKCREAVLLLQQ